jgi:FSR family fosmidomycin resistance protein-like MFS transporter
MFKRLTWANASPLFAIIILYGVELLDEFIYGLQSAVLPHIKSDLALTYTQVGLLFSIPGFIGIISDPIVGLLADTRHRRALVIGGITATALGLFLVAIGNSFALILLAFSILFIASTGYVSLTQATLIDRDPSRAEQTMARWVFWGSIGVMIAPLIVTALFYFGYGWRGLYLSLAGVAGIYAALLLRYRFDSHAGAEKQASAREMIGNLVSALKVRELWRWLLLEELADFMLDKLLEVTGLYFSDVVGVSLAAASGAVAVFTITGLAGDTLLVPTLEKVSGLKLLRLSAIVVLIAYASFLLVPITWLKFVLIGVVSFCTAGWHAILRGKTYSVLPGQSGVVVSVTALGNISAIIVPLVIGRIADTFGLSWAMWVLALGPIAMILGLPKEKS